MQNLREKVDRQIALWERELDHPFWRHDEDLVVGVSGGPDSMALLHLLAKGGLHEPQHIVVGHLDHQLRTSSSAEAKTLAERCQRWDLRFVTDAVDVANLADSSKLTIEEAARVARYRFLGGVAVAVGSRRVVVGHTADDQVETVLMHFVRGTGLAGLRGMLPSGHVPGFPQVRLLRPLLHITRQEIEAYCRLQELDPVRDPSNEDLDFFRNRLRHELLPLLESYNPQLRERLLHTSNVVRADVDYLETLTEQALDALVVQSDKDAFRLDLARWRELPLSMRRRTLRQAVWRLRRTLRDVGFAPIEQARMVAESGPVGAQSSLPGDLVLEVEYDTLLLSGNPDVQNESLPQLAPGSHIPLIPPAEIVLQNGWRLQANLVEATEGGAINLGADRWVEYIDADRAGDLVLRTRRAGERLQPLGMQGQRSKVADVMINQKIPARLRVGWPVLANQEHVVWLVGIALDERARIHENTRRVIQLRCVRVES